LVIGVALAAPGESSAGVCNERCSNPRWQVLHQATAALAGSPLQSLTGILTVRFCRLSLQSPATGDICISLAIDFYKVWNYPARDIYLQDTRKGTETLFPIAFAMYFRDCAFNATLPRGDLLDIVLFEDPPFHL